MNNNENMELYMQNDQLSVEDLDDVAGGCNGYRPFIRPLPRPVPPRPIPPRPFLIRFR